MNALNLKLIMLVASMGLILPVGRARAQESATLEDQIRAAVVAEDDSYFELREKILRQGEAARAALQAATQWDRPEARVIAKAMLKWLDEVNGADIRAGSAAEFKALMPLPENNYRRTAEAVAKISSSHCYVRVAYRVGLATNRAGGWEGSLLHEFYQHTIQGEEDVRKYWPHDVYLLELALKGHTPDFQIVTGKPIAAWMREFHRMCAAAAAGVSPCTNTVAVLTTLLDAKHPARVRQGALAGLAAVWVSANKAVGGGLPEDPRCLPTLDKALNDPDRDVRLAAYRILKLVADENLGIDLVGSTRGLSMDTEVVQTIREHLEKWQAGKKKKAVEDATPVEQGEKSAATPTPPPETAPSP